MLNLNGIIPPLVTPLLSQTKIDMAGLENLIEHEISGGVHGLFLLGTTGEAPHLDYGLRKELIKQAIQIIHNRIPVLVGITDTTVGSLFEMAEYAAQYGADAVVLAAPYYLPVSQKEIIDYYKYVIPKLELPALVYNMPSCTQLHMNSEVIEAAKDTGAVGIKDSSGDWEYLHSLLTKYKNDNDFMVFCGNEDYFPKAILEGGNGAVTGGANMFPKLYVDLYNASLKNDSRQIAVLSEKVNWINKHIYGIGQYSSKYIKSIKATLSILKICNDFVAQPFSKSDANERKQIEENLREFKL